MFDLKPYVTDIMVGNNETMASVSKGQYKGIVVQKDGTSVDITLQDVLYIPKLMVNLFSLTKTIENTGVALSSKGQILSLTVGNTDIYIDKAFKHRSRPLLGIEIHPTPNHIAATAQTLGINVLHEVFGHPSSQILAATAAKYGFNNCHVCSNCAIIKAKQKNLHKLTAHLSRKLGRRINIDISSFQNTSYGGANLPDTMLDWLKLVQKEISLNVKSIQLDNSGENRSFHQLIIKSEFNISFTAPGTTQQNGKVERAFATLFGKTKTVLNEEIITIPLRKGLWANCANLSV
jgi:hypothetical protein